MSILIQGKNVTSYVPKGAWDLSNTGVSLVQVEGAGTTPTVISTPNAVNSCASNSVTGQTVCTANTTDVYLISGATLSSTLTSEGSGQASFSGGSCTNCGVAINAVTNKALLALNTSSGPGFQFLDLAGPPTFEPAFASPSGRISENILINPISKLILSPAENGNYELVDFSSSTPAFFENSPAGSQEFDSAAIDCATGIALASDEFTNKIFLADLTQAKFTPGSPGTWSDPGVNLQSIPDFDSLSAGTNDIAIVPALTRG
ncbi:MAG TPA: hypothetical protein VKJ47_16540 [Candidatus Binatia bacterium]|nr:hypothetical protein [Candidatus Binatia bacterium]